MVAVVLARGWVGYGGAVHRPGELVDVDAVTLARLEASGVVSESASEPWSRPDSDDDERTVAWTPPADDEDDERTVAWTPPADDDDSPT